jgi:predicted tellurium resistance membrane protein TerC
MELLLDPQAWLSFLTLAVLEIVLGIDNIIFLALLVDRLPQRQRRRARYLGSGFAMLTRIALLASVLWMTRITRPLLVLKGAEVSVRNLVLFGGGAFLVVQSALEIRAMLQQRPREAKRGLMSGFWMVIVQVGVIDIVFSVDSVFTAIGLAKRIEVMIAAIVVSVLIMMAVSSAVGRFIEGRPTLKALALAFLILVGISLVGESANVEIPQGYLYFAIAFSGAVEWINIRLRRRG